MTLGLLQPAQLSRIRTRVTKIFDTACTIWHQTNGVYTQVPTAAPLACLVFPAKGTVHFEGLPAILSLQGWTLMLPWDAPIVPGDHVVTDQATYAVQRVEQPSSYNVDTTVHCYQLYGPDGTTPVYLPSNYVVAVERRVPGATPYQSVFAPVAGLEAVPVYITETPAVLQMPTGAVAPSFETKMMWSPQYAIMDGDRVVGFNPSGSANPPLLTVQHVSDPGDVPRRVCVLVGLEQAGNSLRSG